jgi:hypothetical protein
MRCAGCKFQIWLLRATPYSRKLYGDKVLFSGNIFQNM